MSDTCDITVSGMTCAACSSRIQRTLEKTPGVEEAAVNLMTGTATVAFDPAAVSPSTLVDVIRETGYGAELPSADASVEELFEAQDAERAAEIADIRTKFVVSIAAALIAIPLSMTHLAIASPDLVRWSLLALTVPVVFWAGRHFYTRAWAAFRHHAADMNTLIAVGTGAAFSFSLFMTVGAGWTAARGVEPHVYF